MNDGEVEKKRVWGLGNKKKKKKIGRERERVMGLK